jgi:hypothetical protein
MANKINWKSPRVKRHMIPNAKCYGDGEYCVYYWQDRLNDDIFYVGCGKGYRFSDTNEKSRTPEFLERINAGECVPFIVAYGMAREDAASLEIETIRKFWERGEPLTNKQGVPERESEYRAKAEISKELRGVGHYGFRPFA